MEDAIDINNDIGEKMMNRCLLPEVQCYTREDREDAEYILGTAADHGVNTLFWDKSCDTDSDCVEDNADDKYCPTHVQPLEAHLGSGQWYEKPCTLEPGECVVTLMNPGYVIHTYSSCPYSSCRSFLDVTGHYALMPEARICYMHRGLCVVAPWLKLNKNECQYECERRSDCMAYTFAEPDTCRLSGSDCIGAGPGFNEGRGNVDSVCFAQSMLADLNPPPGILPGQEVTNLKSKVYYKDPADYPLEDRVMYAWCNHDGTNKCACFKHRDKTKDICKKKASGEKDLKFII